LHCGEANHPGVQTTLNKNEDLMLVARPHGDRIVSYGTFYGSYSLKGVDYWSVKLTRAMDFPAVPFTINTERSSAYSAVMIGRRKLAVVSPGIRAQKLLEEYAPPLKP